MIKFELKKCISAFHPDHIANQSETPYKGKSYSNGTICEPYGPYLLDVLEMIDLPGEFSTDLFPHYAQTMYTIKCWSDAVIVTMLFKQVKKVCFLWSIWGETLVFYISSRPCAHSISNFT